MSYAQHVLSTHSQTRVTRAPTCSMLVPCPHHVYTRAACALHTRMGSTCMYSTFGMHSTHTTQRSMPWRVQYAQDALTHAVACSLLAECLCVKLAVVCRRMKGSMHVYNAYTHAYRMCTHRHAQPRARMHALKHAQVHTHRHMRTCTHTCTHKCVYGWLCEMKRQVLTQTCS